LPIIEKKVASDVEVRLTTEEFLERLDQVDDLISVQLGLTHGKAVGLRVKDIVISEGDRVHPGHPFSCR